MTAGPTPLPPAVSQVMAEPMLYHRAPAFVEVYARVLERLKQVFGTANEVLVFASSGSGAMESAVANLVRPGEPALVASCGKFGERWAELCDAYGAQTVHWETEWGRKVDPAELDRRLGRARGRRGRVHHALRDLDRGRQRRPRADRGRPPPRRADRRRRRVRPSAPCRCRRTSGASTWSWPARRRRSWRRPGLGFASPNEAALERAAAAPGRRYYFDWERTVSGQRKDPPDSPFTPAVGLVLALDVALGLIEDEGLEEVYERHRLLGRATREAARALDLDTLGDGDENANVVTAIALPESIDGAKVPKLMRDRFGITIAGGQGHLKGKIARIAHCGYFGAFDIVVTVAALRDDPARAGPRARAGRRRGRRPARLPRGGRAGRVSRLDVKVLVKEKIGDSGVAAAARRRLRRRAGRRLGGRRARAAHRRVRRHPDPLRHPADRRPARARPTSSRRSAGPGWGWTTSTWTPPPSAASWWPTRPSRT